MNEESEIGWKTFIVIAFFVLMAITFFTGNYGGKENEDAYRKMKKKGFTSQQIYEMGKE